MTRKPFAPIRAHPSAVRLAILGLLALSASIGLWMAEAALPSDGILIESFANRDPSVATAMLSPITTVQMGDHIEAIGGKSLWEIGNRALWGKPLPAREVGQAPYYRIRHAGESSEIPIRLIPFPWWRWILLHLAMNLFALVVWIEAWYFLLRYPGEQSSHAVFIFGISVGVLTFLPLQISVLWHPWVHLSIYSLKLLAIIGVGVSLPLLSISPPFGHARSFLTHKQLYLSAAGGFIILGILSLLLRDTPMARLAWLQHATRITSSLFILLGLINLWRDCATEHDPLVCNQVAWIMWGNGIGILFLTIIHGILSWLTKSNILLSELTALYFVLLMVFITAAVSRYRIYDVNIFMLRVVGYAFLFIITTAAYIATQYALNRLAKMLFDLELPSFLPLTALLAIAVFELTRPIILRLIAQRFYGEYYPAHTPQFIEQMQQRFAAVLHEEQLIELLGIIIPKSIGAQYGSLLLLNQDGTKLETALGNGHYAVPTSRVTEFLGHSDGNPIVYHQLPDWLPPKASEEMKKRGVHIMVPLQVTGQPVGLFSLGPHQHSRLYTTEELNLIGDIANRAALAVQNVRLVRQMEQQQESLAEEVRQRTAAMTQDRDRLNAILQNMADALLVTSRDGRVLLVNPAFESLVHRSARSLLGHPIEEALPLPELAEIIAQAQHHRAAVNEVTVTVTAPGDAPSAQKLQLTERVLRVAVTALADSSAVIALLRDVTHEVEVFRAKTDFVSNISHELRTPLTSILGFAKLAHRTLQRSLMPALGENRLARRSAKRIDRNLTIIITESERLTQLINDILDIAAFDAGTVVWQEQEYEWPTIVRRSLEQFQNVAQERNLTLQAQLAKSLPTMVGDPKRIQQLLNNLISNALKFTERGTVTVSITPLKGGTTVHEWTTPEEGGVLVSVVDTGIGMSHEVLSNLFKRFRQGGEILSDKPQGAGLGLAICQAILQHYGGDIWITSQVNFGTTVNFTLPAIPPRQARASRSHPETIVPAGKQGQDLPLILIADDEATARAFLVEALLASKKYRLLAVSSGKEVLAYAQEYHPDAILLDVRMPDLSGIEVLQKLKSDLETVSIPIVMLSVADYRESCIALGASAYLMKPLDLRLLYRTLEGLFPSPDSDAPQVEVLK